MIIACCVLIIISIAYIFWIFGLAEISGLCGIIRDINTGNYKDKKYFKDKNYFKDQASNFI